MSPIYRHLLRCYPRAYRAQHGPELLATLAETGGRFSSREALALTTAGLRTRLSGRSGLSPWIDGLHLGLLLYLLLDRMASVPRLVFVLNHPASYLAVAAWAVLVVALLRGKAVVALASGVATCAGELLVTHLADGPLDSRLLPASAGRWAVLFVLLAVLAAARKRGIPTRGWPWALLVLPLLQLAVAVLPAFVPNASGLARLGFLMPSVLVFAALLGAGLLTRSVRWPLAATVHLALTATGVLIISRGESFILIGSSEVPYLPLLLGSLAVVVGFAVGYGRARDGLR
ncbi:hypothetical protein EDD29_1634 [Actinocorallia herbida]|uniref:Uncharacterized protein n=1 Tax=Actinocorallia herbida TaxID=58109 RepID=A0A3N1CS41_9ACTN|nr:hypothetical protein [Actinocorallia herbida]ROO84117.1 hypothetical protein EDD29_1634 [Actinocorallia herbida]